MAKPLKASPLFIALRRIPGGFRTPAILDSVELIVKKFDGPS